MNSLFFHYYMATVQIAFTKDGQTQRGQINVIMALPKEQITMEALDGARLSAIQRLLENTGAEHSSITNVCFLGFSYLGKMTEKQFTGTSDNAPEMSAAPNVSIRPN